MAFLTGGGEGRERAVMLDGRAIVEEGWEVGWPLSMTENASTVAYPLSDRNAGRACVVVNGVRGETFDAVGPSVLSADGKAVAYRAQSGGEHFVVVNGRRLPSYEFVKDPAITPDGRSIVYPASRSGRWFLVIDGQERPIDRQPFDVFIGPDSRFIGYTILDPLPEGGSKVRVVVGAGTGEAFDLVGRPEFGPDGSTFAYMADLGPHRYVVVGSRKIEVAGLLCDPAFAPDGRSVGVGIRIGREIGWKVLRLP